MAIVTDCQSQCKSRSTGHIGETLGLNGTSAYTVVHGFFFPHPLFTCVCVCVIDVGGPADPIAPSIIVAPKNTSVTVGRNEAVMECVANARYD